MNAIIAVVGMVIVTLCFVVFAIGSIILSIEHKRGKKTRAKTENGVPGKSYSDYDNY